MILQKLSNLFIGNFFLCFLLFRLSELMGVPFNFLRIFQIVGFAAGVNYMFKNRYIIFDFLIILYLVYILCNIIIIDYKFHDEMVYYACWTQVIPIFFYFIGKGTKDLSMTNVLYRMKWPISFSVICGMYFFFQPPGWYMQMKMDQLDVETNEHFVMEIFRLSSFWGHPYQIGYATLLFFLYLMYNILNNSPQGRQKMIHYSLITLCVVCLVLAQLRVTIAVSILLLFYYIVMLKKENVGNLIMAMLFVLLVLVGGTFYVMSSESETSTYIVNHVAMFFDQEALSNRLDHTAGGISDYSLLGDGFGRYGFLARKHNGWALVDQEYQRHLAELGFCGISILALILAFTFKKCFCKKYLLLETGVFLFFVIAMMGASVLSNEHQYNFIFWFCVGKIWSCKQSRVINSMYER